MTYRLYNNNKRNNNNGNDNYNNNGNKIITVIIDDTIQYNSRLLKISKLTKAATAITGL